MCKSIQYQDELTDVTDNSDTESDDDNHDHDND